MTLAATFTANAAASAEAIAAAQVAYDGRLPADYLAFMRHANGGEGFFGEHYVQLWRIEEVKNLSDAYQEWMPAPRWILFGSNGGGEAFAFDPSTEQMAVVEVPFITLSREDALFCAASFTTFLERPTGFREEASL